MRNLIKATVVATVIAIAAQAAATTTSVDMTGVFDTAEYVSVGTFGTLMYIEEFEIVSTNNTSSDRKEVIGVVYDIEDATELINAQIVPCEFCGVMCRDWGARYDHDIFVHGYCEEHTEYEDCYNPDGSLKDCYHLTVDRAVKCYK